MIFEYILFKNYRPYYGRQILYFRDQSHNKNKLIKTNIVLIGGLNGHGKTSLINAINICLFGHRKFKNKNLYEDYLSKSVNYRHLQEGGKEGEIELAFSDQNSTYALNVKFDQSGELERTIFELNNHHEVMRLIDLTEEEFYDFIDQRIPLDVSQFFIFDAEKIRELVGNQESEDTAEAIQQIMSLNIYKQLQRDLHVIYRRNINILKDSATEDDVKKVIDDLRKTTDEIDKIYDKEKEVSNRIDLTKIERSELESKRRKILISNSEAKQNISKRIGEYEGKLNKVLENLRHSKDELHQFILQPHIKNLKKTLHHERKLVEVEKRMNMQFAPYRQFINALLESEIKPRLSNKQKRQLKRKGKKIWAELNEINNYEISDNQNSNILHDLSDTDYRRIIDTPEKKYSDIQELVEQKQEYERQIELNKKALVNAPDAVDTSDLNQQISKLDQEIGDLNRQRRTYDFKISELQKLQRKYRLQYEELLEKQNKIGPIQNKIKLIENTQKAIDEFIKKITTLKAKELKHEVETIFEQLFRKSEFKWAEFDEETFALSIYNELGEKVELDSRSEGEKQLIALAMIWALTKVSGSNFPFVIDTPLARLDSSHRSNLVHHYFTKLSEQVIILSTDTEITKNFYEELKPFIEKSYILDFDEEINNTTINEGYFFDQEEGDLAWLM